MHVDLKVKQYIDEFEDISQKYIDELNHFFKINCNVESLQFFHLRRNTFISL